MSLNIFECLEIRVYVFCVFSVFSVFGCLETALNVCQGKSTFADEEGQLAQGLETGAIWVLNRKGKGRVEASNGSRVSDPAGWARDRAGTRPTWL